MPDAVTPPAAASAIDWSAASNSRLPIKTLGQNDFLRLLITQLSSQDPMNPQKDTEFVAQMAQFSALEQTKSMQADMSAIRSEQQLLQANVLIGQTVQLQLPDGSTTSGVVAGVKVDSGTPKLVVDGQAYDLSQILTITPTIFN